MLVWQLTVRNVQPRGSCPIVTGNICKEICMGRFIFHVKSEQLHCVLPGYRDSAGMELQRAGTVMPDKLQETDIAVFLIILIFIEIKDSRVHSCLQSCLSTDNVFGERVKKNQIRKDKKIESQIGGTDGKADESG